MTLCGEIVTPSHHQEPDTVWSFILGICREPADPPASGQREEDNVQAARISGLRGDVNHQMSSASFFKQTFTEQQDANSCSGYCGYSSGHPHESTHTHTLLPFTAEFPMRAGAGVDRGPLQQRRPLGPYP